MQLRQRMLAAKRGWIQRARFQLDSAANASIQEDGWRGPGATIARSVRTINTPFKMTCGVNLVSLDQLGLAMLFELFPHQLD